MQASKQKQQLLQAQQQVAVSDTAAKEELTYRLVDDLQSHGINVIIIVVYTISAA